MKKYKYKNIILFQDWGRWYADYEENGKRYAILRASSRTKTECYADAKEAVEWMNIKNYDLSEFKESLR